MSEREESYSTDVKEFSESRGTDSSDSSRISSNDSDGIKELGVQPYLYEPETSTEGNANITVLFYEIYESKFWSLKKTQNKRRHNEKGLVFLCLSCQDINSDTMFLFMWKIKACFMPRTLKLWASWCEHVVCTEVDWVMHGSITKWLLTLSLSRFKNTSLLRGSYPSLLT